MFCWSADVPSVASTSACVSPRVKSDEPCVRGRTLDVARDGPHVAAGAAVEPRPSFRIARGGASSWLRRTEPCDILGAPIRVHLGESGLDLVPAPRRALRSARACPVLLDRGSDLRHRDVRDARLDAPDRLQAWRRIALRLADGGAELLLQVDERLRRLVRDHERVDDDRLRLHLGAPPSTITMASRLNGDERGSGRPSSWSTVGLTTNLPSRRPTRTPTRDPPQGMSVKWRAADAPVMARTSEAFYCRSRRPWR